jgi:general secretion pathway protein D
MRLKLVLLIISFFISIKTEPQDKNSSGAELLKAISEKDSVEKAENLTIDLNYHNEDLINIINKIAKIKNLKLLIPEDVKIVDKITINLGTKKINEAWNFVQIMLEKIGYSIIKKDAITYSITQVKNINKEPLPLFINIPFEGLPNSEDRIRYLYYFKNINISKKTNNLSRTNIENMLKDFLPSNSDNNFWFDDNSNSLLISNKASSIKDIMNIISEFDATGFRETVLVLPLFHANAAVVSTILNKLIPEESPYQFSGQTQQQPKFGYYFSENTKISSIEKTNAVVILGNMESVSRVRDFISKYLDKPLDSGSSVLHIKTLQYLNANEIQPILQSIVKAEGAATQSVTQQELKDTLSKVIIAAEKEQPASMLEQMQSVPVGQGQTITPQAPIVGGNNLIIAAQPEDWKILNRLIDELDIPQIQVALEVLVVDLSISDSRLLGGQSRDIAQAAQKFNWQAAHLVKPWLNFTPSVLTGPNINMARGLAADLLQMTQKNTIGISSSTDIINIATLAQAGSTIISFNDGNGISNILQIFDQYGNATILSQPFVTTKNHHIAKISISETRLVPGAVQQQSTGGPAILPKDTIPASLVVQMIPRVSNTNNINLEITVTADDFVSSSTDNNTINNRAVVTNANIGNKEVLVLGGLTKKTTTGQQLSTPPLSRIPIIGWFFKKKSQTTLKSTLMIFIQPTIIKPRIGGGMDPYTQKKLQYAQQKECNFEEEIEGANFENLKDPITRFFFTPPLANTRNAEIEAYGETGVYALNPYDECCNQIENFKYNSGDPRSCACKEIEFQDKEDRLKNLIQNTNNPLFANQIK